MGGGMVDGKRGMVDGQWLMVGCWPLVNGGPLFRLTLKVERFRLAGRPVLVDSGGGMRMYESTNPRPPVPGALPPAHGPARLQVLDLAFEGLALVADVLAAAQGKLDLDLVVEQEEAVYPMVPAGAALDQMIRRPVRQESK